ncbi:MAG: RlmE family RNA methyltransferase [Candidatus Pacebacteria bacterium]|nr:RlmE family RNA methyltransferase [Candidatus Paceibacterota bacterium]
MKREFSKNDFFTQKAKEQGYPARSVYKLQEIDEKFNLLQKGFFVLDLGAAPGSWLLYIANKVSMTGKAVGVDILDLNTELPSNAIFVKKSVLDTDFLESGALGSANFNVVVSDMAPNTTGLREVDVANCLELTQKALEIAKEVLVGGGLATPKPSEARLRPSGLRRGEGGDFVCKIFEGPGTDNFVKETKKYFKMVKRYRPRAVRRGSKEFYLIAKGFKGSKI